MHGECMNSVVYYLSSLPYGRAVIHHFVFVHVNLYLYCILLMPAMQCRLTCHTLVIPYNTQGCVPLLFLPPLFLFSIVTIPPMGDPRRPHVQHQNKVAFRHNPSSRKTAKILAAPNAGLCTKCHDIIEWRKRYRKYKPLTTPRRWYAEHTLYYSLPLFYSQHQHE